MAKAGGFGDSDELTGSQRSWAIRVDFDGDDLVGLGNERGDLRTSEIFHRRIAGGPTSMWLEVLQHIGSELWDELGTHVGARMKAGGGTSEKSTHVGDVGTERAAEKLVKAKAPAVEVYHVDERCKGRGTGNSIGKGPSNEVREMCLDFGKRNSWDGEVLGMALSSDEPRVEDRG
jgi:hypothetical protein